MKKLLLLSLLGFYTQISAQNVGIGNPTPAEKLDVTGNINVTGTIKANGVDGSANQVLSKNASNNLAWVNTAHANNTRFSLFAYNTNFNSGFQNLIINTDFYNINNTNVYYTTSSSAIVFNKGGLYHFDVDIQATASLGSSPSAHPQFFVTFQQTAGTGFMRLGVGNAVSTATDNTSWLLQGSKSFDMNIVAGTNYYIRGYVLNAPVNNIGVLLSGHLIAD